MNDVTDLALADTTPPRARRVDLLQDQWCREGRYSRFLSDEAIFALEGRHRIRRSGPAKEIKVPRLEAWERDPRARNALVLIRDGACGRDLVRVLATSSGPVTLTEVEEHAPDASRQALQAAVRRLVTLNVVHVVGRRLTERGHPYLYALGPAPAEAVAA